MSEEDRRQEVAVLVTLPGFYLVSRCSRFVSTRIPARLTSSGERTHPGASVLSRVPVPDNIGPDNCPTRLKVRYLYPFTVVLGAVSRDLSHIRGITRVIQTLNAENRANSDPYSLSIRGFFNLESGGSFWSYYIVMGLHPRAFRLIA